MATQPIMNTDPYTIPLDAIDVSQRALFQQDTVGHYFKRLRQEAPIHFCASSDYGPFWSVTRYKDIMQVDTNHKVFSSEGKLGGILLNQQALRRMGQDTTDTLELETFIAMDPPKHDVQRAAVSPVVAPRNLARLEEVVRGHAQDILDNLPRGEDFDWVKHVSIELTTRMLATIFGFPFEERRKLTRWSDVAVSEPGDGRVDTYEQRIEELMECANYFMNLYGERLSEDNLDERTDLLSMLANSPATRNMPPDEFLGNILLLIVGGNDTTRNSITGGVLALNRYPDQYAKLTANPSLIPGMIPEIIRWVTPLSHMARTALSETEIGGKTIREGDRVVMWYQSGNRDEEVFDRPEELVIDRPSPRQHLSFGYGIHRCVGNRLAELQLRVLWEEILARFKRIEVTGEAKRVYSNIIHGFESMSVRVHPN